MWLWNLLPVYRIYFDIFYLPCQFRSQFVWLNLESLCITTFLLPLRRCRINLQPMRVLSWLLSFDGCQAHEFFWLSPCTGQWWCKPRGKLPCNGLKYIRIQMSCRWHLRLAAIRQSESSRPVTIILDYSQVFNENYLAFNKCSNGTLLLLCPSPSSPVQVWTRLWQECQQLLDDTESGGLN